MPSVNRANQSSIDDTTCHGPEQAPVTAPVSTPQQDAANQVTAYRASPEAPRGALPAGQEAGPSFTPQQLALASQVEQKNLQALDRSLERLRDVVVAARWGGGALSAEQLKLVQEISRSPEFAKLTEECPKELVSDTIRRFVQASSPGASRETIDRVHAGIVQHINETLVVQAAQDMKRDVVGKLKSAAANFEQAARDPKELERTSQVLSGLPPREASQLREALGLDEKGPTDPATIKTALLKRASLIRSESDRMQEAGVGTLYRNLLLHVGAADSKQAAPDSWRAQAVRDVTHRGHNDESAIKYAKLASSVALGLASGGMGLGVIGSMSMTAAFNMPGLNSAIHKVDHARAGVSAGTADATAIVQAQRHVAVEVVETVVATGTSGVLAAHGAHAAVTLTDATLGHAVTDGAAELVIGGGALVANELLHPHAEGVPADAISRVRERR